MNLVERLKRLANWLWGGTHRNTTLPVTHDAKTYRVCVGPCESCPVFEAVMEDASERAW